MKDFITLLPRVIIIGGSIGFWFWLWMTARKNTPLGNIIRPIWNACYTFAACIPFCGWMSCFIVAKTKEEMREKRRIQEMGEETDSIVWGEIEKNARKEQREREELEQLNIQVRERYGANVTSWDRETDTVYLSNGKRLYIDRD